MKAKMLVAGDPKPSTQAEIAAALRRLAAGMDDVAVAMDYYGGFAEWAKHGREIAGAGAIARQWAAEIEVASVEVQPRRKRSTRKCSR